MDKGLTAEQRAFIDHADADTLRDLLETGLESAQRQRDKHNTNNKILAKLGRKTVTFVTNFSSFLEAYSGIVEIMKGADQQYGGAAYSILSLALIVCRCCLLMYILLQDLGRCE